MASVKPKPKRKPGPYRKSTRSVARGGFEIPKFPKPLKQTKIYCNAKNRNGTGRCRMPAGWGTNHFGIGRCKHHLGNAPSHVRAAATGEFRRMLGDPIDINPLDALILCIRIRAGEIQWLGERMAELDQKDWIEDTIAGKQFHLYARERQKAMQDLARFSQMAISLGIAERAVKLAETYGEMLARLIQGILEDLELSEEQRAKAPQIVRRHLIAIDRGRPKELESSAAA